MSELKNKSTDWTNLRARLLATACGTALLVTLCASEPAMASDADKPMLWVELGGAFTKLENGQEAYLPPFTLNTPRLPFITEPPAGIEKPAPTSWDGDAKISFVPSGSDWVFSVGIRYGRSEKNKSLSQRTTQPDTYNPYFLQYFAYQNLSAQSAESHMVLDFQAGKDVGLGRFGSGGSSVVRAGLRYAQFDSRNKVGIQYQPTNTGYAGLTHHRFYGSFGAKRKFSGVGPSLSWDASADLLGNPSGSELSFDWGVNGAILFGRQRANIHRQTSDVLTTYPRIYSIGFAKHPVYQHSASPVRSKQVIVPNLGGFAGVSWRYPNAKISVGYRADFFFGAMDGGIDAAKKENVGFFGPFAAVSIGIGG